MTGGIPEGKVVLISGKPKAAPAKTPSLTQVFGDALLEIARADNRIIAITGAMPDGCGARAAESCG